MPTDPTWEDTEAIDTAPTWDDTEPVSEPSSRPSDALRSQMTQLQIEGEQARAANALAEGSESVVERLTPSGILNQPFRALGKEDYFEPGKPSVDFLEPSGTGFISGLGKLGVRTLESLTTPESIVTLPAAGARLGQALFAGQMASHLPESISQAGEVARDPNQPLSEKVAAVGQPLLEAAILREVGRTPQWIPDRAQMRIQPDKPVTLEPVLETKKASTAETVEAEQAVPPKSEQEIRGGIIPNQPSARTLSKEGVQAMKSSEIIHRLDAIGQFVRMKSEHGDAVPAETRVNIARLYEEARKRNISPEKQFIEDYLSQESIPKISEVNETQGATLSPAPLVPSSVPPSAVTPKALSEVIRDISKGLGVPIRFGRLTTPKFGGYFKKKQNLIGAKYANDVPIIGHEAGHKLDSTFALSSDPMVAGELSILGDPATAGSMSSWTKSKSGAYKLGEGTAEFVRYWLTDPTHASTVAPNMSRAFEAALNSNPDFGRVMRQARDDIQLWRNAEPEARLNSSISTSDPNGAKYGLSDLTRDVVDDLHYLRLATDDAKKLGADIPPSQNPYLNARLLRGSYGMADTFLRKGIVDFKTKAVNMGTSLEDVLKPVSGRIDEFRRWIVAKQAQELHAQGKKTGLVDSDVNFVARKYDSDPTFQSAFQGFKQWNDALLKYAVDGGLVSPDAATAMRTMNQDYVPFHRVFEVGAGEMPALEGAGAGRGLNVGKPGSIRGRHGSQRDIVDPLETVIKNAYAIITATEKNSISTSLADMLDGPGMGKWGDRIKAPMQKVGVDVGRLRDQLEALGADLSKVPDDVVVNFFKQSGQPIFGENVIKVNRSGNPEYYRLKKELFDTFHALDMDAGGTFIRLISQPAQWLRAGVTLTPDFATFNALRDTVSSAVLSRYGSLPFQSTLQGLGALMKNPKLVAEWAASGGKQSVEASFFDRAKLQKFLSEKISKDPTLGQEIAMWAKSPLTALRYFTGLLEEATRVGEYQTVFKKLTSQGMPEGEARRLAAFEARDLQDFGKGGSKTKPVRMMAAFWNAQLQANVRLANAFKNKPKETILKGMAFVTVPKLIEQAINWNDPDYWDRPQWERDLFFMIPYGKDENGHSKFFRIPVPFEIGLIFAAFPGRVLQSIREKNPESVKEFPAAMAKSAVPYQMVPQWVTALMELNAGKQGYSFYRGKPIVPTSVADRPPELQFTEQNSLTARHIGNLLKMSPAKIDYAINALTGGLGKQVTHQLADRAISAVTGEERTAKSTTPFGRFVSTPAGVQSQAVEDFYEALGLAEEDAERSKAGLGTTGARDNLQMLRAKAKVLSEYRRKIREEKDEVRRKQLAYDLAQTAKKTLDQIKAHQKK